MRVDGTLLQGRYRLDKVIGQGGMGTVYRAVDTRLENLAVAVKELCGDGTRDDTWELSAQMFLREARILATLDHPGLVHVSDCFEDGDSVFLVMELVAGDTLDSFINQTGKPIPPSQVVSWARELCTILTYVHNHVPPVILRDIKPNNIMMQKDGCLRLIDFGLARFFASGGTLTASGAAMGTPGFAPVEQYGEERTDPRADIYALGATLYSLVTMVVPPASVLRGFDDPLKPCRDANPDVPERLDQVILKMMAVRREHRFQTVEEVLGALDRLDAPPCVRCGTVPNVLTGGCACRARPVRPKWIGLAGLAALLLVVVGVVLYSLGGARQRPSEFVVLRSGGGQTPTWMAAFVDGDTHLVTGDDNATLFEVWDVATGAMEAHPGKQCLLSPDHSILYSGLRTIYVTFTYVSGTGFTPTKELRAPDTEQVVDRACFSPDSSSLLLVSEDHAWVYDARGASVDKPWPSPGGTIKALAWSPDGRQVAAGTEKGQLDLWMAPDGFHSQEWAGGSGEIDAIDWAPDAGHFLTGDRQGQLVLWDIHGNRRILMPSGPPITAVVYSRDGTWAASGDESGGVVVWRTRDWTRNTLSWTHEGLGGSKVLALAWSDDGRRLAVGRNDSSVLLWKWR